MYRSSALLHVEFFLVNIYIKHTKLIIQDYTSGVVHIINHFKMDLYLKMSCSINIHMIYSFILFFSCSCKILIQSQCSDSLCEQDFELVIVKILVLMIVFSHVVVCFDIFTEKMKKFIKMRRHRNRVNPNIPLRTMSKDVETQNSPPPPPTIQNVENDKDHVR